MLFFPTQVCWHMATTVATGGWKVLISSKEPDALVLVSRLLEEGISAERYDIPVCDIAIVKGDRTYVQAELKTQRDLVQSIVTDCRYHEQTASMSVSGVPFTFYLLHGYKAAFGISVDDQVKVEHGMTRAQLSSSLAKVQPPAPLEPPEPPPEPEQFEIVDGAGESSGEPGNVPRTHIGCIPITSPDGVFLWVKYVYRNLVEDPQLSDGVFAPLTENVRHAFGSKPAARSQTQVYVEQLSRLTGIGEEKAREIAKWFPSMGRLLDFLRGCDSAKQLVKHFTALKAGLGPKACERMYTQLLAKEERKFFVG